MMAAEEKGEESPAAGRWPRCMRSLGRCISELRDSRTALLAIGIILSNLSILIMLSFLPGDLLRRISKISISATEASIRFESGDSIGAVLYIPAQGGSSDTPWVDTKIAVKKGDVVILSASGRVHNDIYKLVADARADTSLGEPWSTPAGLGATGAASSACDSVWVAPGAPIGALIGAIQSASKEIPIPFFVGVSSMLRADQSGSLLLTVNDGWLRPDARERYAHLKEDCSLSALKPECLVGMHTNVKLDMLWLGKSRDEIDKLDLTELNAEAEKLISRRHYEYTTIVENKDFDSWYRDNVGGYVVAVEVRPCEGDECALDPPKPATSCTSYGGAPGPK